MPNGQPIIRPMLGLIDVELEIVARRWPPQVPPGPADRPRRQPSLRHPRWHCGDDHGRGPGTPPPGDQHGADEGSRSGSLLTAGRLRDTRAAQATNLKTRDEAIRLLGEVRRSSSFLRGRCHRADAVRAGAQVAVEAVHRTHGAGDTRIGASRLLRGSVRSAFPPRLKDEHDPAVAHVHPRRVSPAWPAARRRAGDVVPFEALKHGKDRKALMAQAL